MTDPSPDPYQDAVAELTHLQLQGWDERLERACEQALQGGRFGVLVDGDQISVDERVPYGRIYDVTACGADNVVWQDTAPH